MNPALSQEFHLFCEQEHPQRHANTDKNPYCVYGTLKSISFSKLLCKREDFIQYCFKYNTSTPCILVLRGTYGATVRAISIIVRLSNALQDFSLLSVIVAIIVLHVPCELF